VWAPLLHGVEDRGVNPNSRSRYKPDQVDPQVSSDLKKNVIAIQDARLIPTNGDNRFEAFTSRPLQLAYDSVLHYRPVPNRGESLNLLRGRRTVFGIAELFVEHYCIAERGQTLFYVAIDQDL
jgi:hypothetical protein